MVLDHEADYGWQWAAICSVADKLGPKAETVRLWFRVAAAGTPSAPYGLGAAPAVRAC
jgi:transposase